MFNHIFLGSNDLAAAREFYDAVFAAMGYTGEPTVTTGPGRLIYRHKGATLGLVEPIDGEPASICNGGTIGLICDSADQVDAWHAAGLAHGGTAIEDPPGPRQTPAGPMYLAYLRDPDGHKLCALYRQG